MEAWPAGCEVKCRVQVMQHSSMEAAPSMGIVIRSHVDASDTLKHVRASS